MNQIKSIVVVGLLSLFAFASSCAASSSPPMLEQTSNGFNHKAVCSNHNYGSMEYRSCRSNAKKYFEQMCNSFSKRKGSSDNLKQMYCYSARHFNPLQ